MHTKRFRGYVHRRAIWGRCNTRHGAHLDRREVGGAGEPEMYTRCRRCRVASIFCVQMDPSMRLGLPKARAKNAFTCQPLRAHTRLLTCWRILMGERWVTQT